MGRLNATGVRGLTCQVLPDGSERYIIDLRFRDATGAWQRYREALPNGISAAAAKRKARLVNNAAESGTLETNARGAKRLGEALDAVVEWAKSNRPASLQARK